ncbi:Leucine-rich repeat protein soc-2 [Phytophthora citrophthora]|uniref:Leucine-rich repeat protein soc-2 n=1 Tax=Phytophthora citrophthora TaxID=4793 RepID=A0AAD9G596_9STRA|nr:Leucine-rich repeat protein soc-2 [Phytophthora citrophthora]
MEGALEQRYTKCNGSMLDLSSLQLKELPPLEELSQRFPHLRQLNLRRNALRSFPDDLAQVFPQLVALNVSENALEELPTSIRSFHCLQRLNVAHNRLNELSLASFEELEAFEELDARRNLIERILIDNGQEKLPGSRLRKLQVLLLTDNHLRSIDTSTTDYLPKLRVIDLSGNPELTEVPEKLRRLHERNLLLHSRAKRRELITRALSIRKAVAQALATTSSTSK